jgi:hypothetical protein
MKTHTPGPWHVVSDPQWEGKHPNHSHRFICNVPAFAQVYPPTEGEDDGWQVFHDDVGRTICHMTDTIEIESNARLIASAPDLLSALEFVSGILSQPVFRNDSIDSASSSIMRNDAKVALHHIANTIAKATGTNA